MWAETRICIPYIQNNKNKNRVYQRVTTPLARTPSSKLHAPTLEIVEFTHFSKKNLIQSFWSNKQSKKWIHKYFLLVLT